VKSTRKKPGYLSEWANKDPSIPMAFVVAALAGAKKQGLDVKPVLSQAKIEPELLNEAHARVSPDQYTRLIQTLWLTMEDEFMGLLEEKTPLGTFSMMCLSVIHCKNLHHVIKRTANYYKISLGWLDWQLEECGEDVILSFRFKNKTPAPNIFLQECLMVIMHRLLCWLIGERIILNKARFSYPQPGYVNEYYNIFCNQLAFDQPNSGLQFNRRYLDTSVIQNEHTLKEFLKESPANIVAKPKYDDSYTAKVRSFVNQRADKEFPTLEEVAISLHTTSSTLHRHLKSENSSYQSIKDGIRRDIAIYLLAETQLSLQDIAEKLGYSEASTFQHAFKKWTGLAPGIYRGKG